MSGLENENSRSGNEAEQGSFTALNLPVGDNDPPTVVTSAAQLASDSANKTSGSGSKTAGGDYPASDMPASGTKIGNYELGLPIGTGGMATVYAAQDLALERTVALKILPPKSAQDSEVLQRFLMEGKAAAQLDHPNIARIHALGHDGQFYFLAFEYVEGRTVRQWLDERGQLEVDQVLDWSSQVADALAHADRRGVVHRDIKPSNLIVMPSGQVKLVDLGLARRYEINGKVELTQTGVTLGTFDYISPEQARDPRNVDIRSDLYSLGCSMFHMLAGVPPFPGQNMVQKLLQHQEKQPPNLMALNPRVPQQLADFIARLMAKLPADRPASADICLAELKSIINDRKIPSVFDLTAEVEPSSVRGLMTWLVPAVVLTSIVTFAAWLTGQVSRPDKDQVANELPGGTVSREADGSSQAITKTGINPTDTPGSQPERQPAPVALRVTDTESFVQALQNAVPGSVILLREPGPYRLKWSELKTLTNLDLTISAERGVSPVIAPQGDAPQNSAERALLAFKNSRIVLQGLTFNLSNEMGSGWTTALKAEECDLLLRDVTFLSDQAEGQDLSAFIRLMKNDQDDDRAAWRPVRLENCRFLGPRVAVSAWGPLDMTMTDTAHLSSEPLVSVESGERDRSWPCLIQLDHVSVMATGWTPVLELNNAPARVRVQNSIFAPRPGGQISLVSSRWPSRLDWFGRGNLYGEVTTFLESTRFDEEVLTYDSWSHAGSLTREQNSIATKLSIFSPVDSVLLASQGRWSDAFALNRGQWSDMTAGVRTLGGANAIEVAALPADNPAENRAESAQPGSNSARTQPSSATELAEQSRPTGLETQPPVDVRSDQRVGSIKPIPMENRTAEGGLKKATDLSQNTENLSGPDLEPGTSREVAALTKGNASGFLGLGNRGPGRTEKTPTSRRPEAAPTDLPVVRNIAATADLKKALSDNSLQGAAISLAAGGQISLADTIKLKTGRWIIGAEQGSNRPRLQISSRNQALVEGDARWSVESGVYLRFRGLDIEWNANEPAQQRLFDVAAGGQLVFEDCTLTLQGSKPDLFLLGSAAKEGSNPADTKTQKASIKLIDCFVRTAGGLIRIPSNVQTQIDLDGTLAVVGKPLITMLAPLRTEPTQISRLEMNQTTAILGSSLAAIQQGRGGDESPHLECLVKRSILAADPAKDSPMIEVRDSDPNKLETDCLTWVGDEVGYHQWLTYRLDQNDVAGMLARRQNREDWQLSHADDDRQALHGDLGFQHDFRAEERPIWNALPTDFSINPNSSGKSLGARIDRLPTLAAAKTKEKEQASVTTGPE